MYLSCAFSCKKVRYYNPYRSPFGNILISNTDMFMALDTLKCHDPYQKTVVCVSLCAHAHPHEFPCVHTHGSLLGDGVYSTIQVN